MVKKMYILMRTDLGMSSGKMCAQAGHAVQLLIQYVMFRTSDIDMQNKLIKYMDGDYTKIVLAVSGEFDMIEVENQCHDKGIPTIRVYDLGYTQVVADTWTCMVTFPEDEGIMRSIMGKFNLLK